MYTTSPNAYCITHGCPVPSSPKGLLLLLLLRLLLLLLLLLRLPSLSGGQLTFGGTPQAGPVMPIQPAFGPKG